MKSSPCVRVACRTIVVTGLICGFGCSEQPKASAPRASVNETTSTKLAESLIPEVPTNPTSNDLGAYISRIEQAIDNADIKSASQLTNDLERALKSFEMKTTGGAELKSAIASLDEHVKSMQRQLQRDPSAAKALIEKMHESLSLIVEFS